MVAVAHVPERTCVACRTTRPKQELIRIARSSDGRAHPDPAGTTPGRGAYVCRDLECIRASRTALARALRTTGEAFATLPQELEALV